MKVYFTGQLWRKDEYLEDYLAIIKAIKQIGHEVLEDTLESDAKTVLAQTKDDLNVYYKKWYEYLRWMDVCVADVTFPSTINVGFEIATILNHGKPVVALHRKGADPVFISPGFASRMIKLEYEPHNIEEVLMWALEEVELWARKRFTFLIENELEKRLEIGAKKRGLSKSEYLRKLIRENSTKK